MLAWAVSLLVWKFGHIEEKWEQGLTGVDPEFEGELERGLDLTLDDDLGLETQPST